MTAPLLLALAGVLAGWHLAPAGPPSRVPSGATPIDVHLPDPRLVVGRVVRRWAGRRPDPDAERRTGGALLGALVLGALAPPLAAAPLAWCLAAPLLRLRR